MHLVCDCAIATQREILLKKASLSRKPIHAAAVNLDDVRLRPLFSHALFARWSQLGWRGQS